MQHRQLTQLRALSHAVQERAAAALTAAAQVAAVVLAEEPAGVPEAMQRAAGRLHDAGLLVRACSSHTYRSVRAIRAGGRLLTGRPEAQPVLLVCTQCVLLRRKCCGAVQAVAEWPQEHEAAAMLSMAWWRVESKPVLAVLVGLLLATPAVEEFGGKDWLPRGAGGGGVAGGAGGGGQAVPGLVAGGGARPRGARAADAALPARARAHGRAPQGMGHDKFQLDASLVSSDTKSWQPG